MGLIEEAREDMNSGEISFRKGDGVRVYIPLTWLFKWLYRHPVTWVFKKLKGER